MRLSKAENASAALIGCGFALIMIGLLSWGMGVLTAWFVTAMFGFTKPWWMWSVAWFLIGMIGNAFKSSQSK